MPWISANNYNLIPITMKTIKLNKDSYGNKFVGLENEINKFHFDIFKYATNDYTIIISVYGLKRKNENVYKKKKQKK